MTRAMPDAPARCRFLVPGHAAREGACTVALDPPCLRVTPSGGQGWACDYGEIERFQVGENGLTLTLLDGTIVELFELGRALPALLVGLRDGWRDRTTRSLLLDAHDERARFEGWARRIAPDPRANGPAQVRVYPGHLAVLPAERPAFPLPLAAIEHFAFDAATYTYTVEAPPVSASIGYLARDTERFGTVVETLRAERLELARRTFRETFPQLPEARLDRLVERFREGRAVPVSALAAIDPPLQQALVDNVVGHERYPYYENLAARAVPSPAYVAFGLVPRVEAHEAAEPLEDEDTNPHFDDGAGDGAADDAVTDAGGHALVPLFSFLFPVPVADGRRLAVAWEPMSPTGRATYFFRPDDIDDASPERAVGSVNAALARVGYRREPVYLSAATIVREPRVRHYAIAEARVPELRWLRAHLVGRAIHNGVDAWGRACTRLLV